MRYVAIFNSSTWQAHLYCLPSQKPPETLQKAVEAFEGVERGTSLPEVTHFPVCICWCHCVYSSNKSISLKVERVISSWGNIVESIQSWSSWERIISSSQVVLAGKEPAVVTISPIASSTYAIMKGFIKCTIYLNEKDKKSANGKISQTPIPTLPPAKNVPKRLRALSECRLKLQFINNRKKLSHQCNMKCICNILKIE